MIKESRAKSLDINEVNYVIYATACVTTGKTTGKKIMKRPRRKRKQPLWKIKLDKEIKNYR